MNLTFNPSSFSVFHASPKIALKRFWESPHIDIDVVDVDVEIDIDIEIDVDVDVDVDRRRSTVDVDVESFYGY